MNPARWSLTVAQTSPLVLGCALTSTPSIVSAKRRIYVLASSRSTLPVIVSLVVLLGLPSAASASDLPPDPSDVADESLAGEPDDTESVDPFPLAPEEDRFESDELGVITSTGGGGNESNPWADALSCANEINAATQACVADLDVAIADLESRLAAPSHARSSSPAEPSYVPLPQDCVMEALNNNSVANMVQRFSACHIAPGVITLSNAKHVAVGGMNVMIYSYDYTARDEKVWSSQIEVSVLSAWGIAAAGVSARLQPSCSGACKTAGGVVGLQPLAIGVDARSQAYWEWKRSGPKTAGFSHPGWTLTAMVPGRNIRQQAVLPLDDVRCDNIIGNSRAGCVFPQAIPSITFKRATYWFFGSHVVSAQYSGLPGSFWSGRPLHRTRDRSVIAANRSVACPPTSAGGPIRPQDYSCDEYPFASTSEGAAAAPLEGRTSAFCQYPGLPTINESPQGWSACMIPKSENSSSGAVLNHQLYRAYRVLDGDAFWIEITNG